MKRKYPKTKGMTVIFEKQRVNKLLDTEVFREIHRRHLRGEKITRIIDDMINDETYGWKMMHKTEKSWCETYSRFRGKYGKKLDNCQLRV